MRTIYEIMGMVVFWGIIYIGLVALIWNIVSKIVKELFKLDFINYNMGRTVETYLLRDIYQYYKFKNTQKRYLLKFRLRNIKRARK